MSEVPTPKQALILWCLLGRHGSSLHSALVPRVDKADREALIAGRYLEAVKQGRSLQLTVTDNPPTPEEVVRKAKRSAMLSRSQQC